MTRLKRYNREIVVRDDMVAAYLEQGYAVIDGQGNVIAEGKAMGYGSALQRIAELDMRNKSLAVALEAANAKVKELTKVIAEKEKTIAELQPAAIGQEDTSTAKGKKSRK